MAQCRRVKNNNGGMMFVFVVVICSLFAGGSHGESFLLNQMDWLVGWLLVKSVLFG